MLLHSLSFILSRFSRVQTEVKIEATPLVRTRAKYIKVHIKSESVVYFLVVASREIF